MWWPKAVQYSTNCSLNACLALQIASSYTFTQDRQVTRLVVNVDLL